jgi:hypothetical protein
LNKNHFDEEHYRKTRSPDPRNCTNLHASGDNTPIKT